MAAPPAARAAAIPVWSMCPCVSTTALTSERLLPIAARLLSRSRLYPGSPASTSVTPAAPASTAYQFTYRVPARQTPGTTCVGVMAANLVGEMPQQPFRGDQPVRVGAHLGDLRPVDVTVESHPDPAAMADVRRGGEPGGRPHGRPFAAVP